MKKKYLLIWIALILAGCLFSFLGFSQTYETELREDLNQGSAETALLEEGSTMTQTVSFSGSMTQLYLSAGSLSGQKDSALCVTLTGGNGQTFESTAALKGKKAHSRIRIDWSDSPVPAGSYEMTVSLTGSGSMTLLGSDTGTPSAVLNGEKQGCALTLRLMLSQRKRCVSLIYFGVSLILLSCLCLIPGRRRAHA